MTNRILTAFTLFLLAAPSQAVLISISGNNDTGSGILHTDPLTTASDVTPGTTTDNNLMQGFNETQDIVLSSPIDVVFGTSGATTTLAVGTMLDSHFLWFDPTSGSNSITGVVASFDRPVLGVIVTDAGLFDTHGTFGLSGITYPATNVTFYGTDGVDILVSGSTITATLVASNPGDYMRVLTTPSSLPDPGLIPEPTTVALLGLGMAVLGFSRKRSKE